MDVASHVETARRAAEAGGAVALDLFRTDLAVETKDGKTDLVTRADREAQATVASTIHESFPEATVVGEEDETPGTVPESRTAWIIDPIDGTNNFVRGMSTWATSVAVTVDGEAVGGATVVPAVGDIYVADRSETRRNGDPVNVSDRTDRDTFTVAPTVWWGFDRREEYATAAREIVTRFGDLARFRCAQATLAMVADGSLEATVTNVRTNPWDTVAGAYMVERAGGTVTDLDGQEWRHDSEGLVASNGRRHDEVLAAARAIDGADSS